MSQSASNLTVGQERDSRGSIIKLREKKIKGYVEKLSLESARVMMRRLRELERISANFGSFSETLPAGFFEEELDDIGRAIKSVSREFSSVIDPKVVILIRTLEERLEPPALF